MKPVENTSPPSTQIQRIFLFGLLLDLILVVLSRAFIPTTGFISLAGASLMIFLYGLGGRFVFHRLHPEAFKIGAVFGLLAGFIFAAEILLEYALLPKDNTNWGWVEFGSVFIVYFLSGLQAARRERSIKQGTLTAVMTAMLSSVIWLVFLLLTFYLFHGTTRQELVLAAEGSFEDFARSGMKDVNAFIMEDLLGAGFFHLLLAPILAAILGLFGALFGKVIPQLKVD